MLTHTRSWHANRPAHAHTHTHIVRAVFGHFDRWLCRLCRSAGVLLSDFFNELSNNIMMFHFLAVLYPQACHGVVCTGLFACLSDAQLRRQDKKGGGPASRSLAVMGTAGSWMVVSKSAWPAQRVILALP